jgi:Domain of unknown function (DUF4177)
MIQQWEYAQVYCRPSELKRFQEVLDRYGLDGFELVSMMPIETKNVGWFDSGSETTGIVSVFKRPKQTAE